MEIKIKSLRDLVWFIFLLKFFNNHCAITELKFFEKFSLPKKSIDGEFLLTYSEYVLTFIHNLYIYDERR